MKCSCIILSHNEESRIATALSHASKWADEVIVVDKESTDATRDIALRMGARVEEIPFSKQGFEDLRKVHSLAKNEWTWLFSPGEVPTRECIKEGFSQMESNHDGVIVPMRYYSFGQHNQASPWGVSGQPRLIQRFRVRFTGIAHDPIRAEKWGCIPYGQNCYVLHQTHATARSFMLAHTDYMEGEAMNGTPDQVIERAIGNLSAWDGAWAGNGDLVMQSIGWKIYWLGVALHAMERKRGDVPLEYSARAAELLAQEWALTFAAENLP